MDVMQLIPLEDISDQEITLDFVLSIISKASEDAQARGFVMHLTRQSLEEPLARVKEYLGDSGRIDTGTIGEPFIQPGYVEEVDNALTHSLYSTAASNIIGTPVHYRFCLCSAHFERSSWWIKDAPALPLSSFMLWARSLAWYLYWFAEHTRGPRTE